MNGKLIIDVAKSLLLARWRQTLVAAVGVMFSITMFVTLLSFMGGLNNLLDGLVTNRTPHIRIYNEIKATPQQPIQKMNGDSGYSFIRSLRPKADRADIKNSLAILSRLKKDPDVLGVAPKLNTPVFYQVGALQLAGNISGIDVEEEARLLAFKDYVTFGNYQDLQTVGNSIILGKAAADKMMVKLGDVLEVTSNKGIQIPLKVVGFFQSGLRDIDLVQSYTTLSTAQKLLNVPSSYITDIQVKLRDINQAPESAKKMEQLFQADAESIQESNAQFETGTRVRNIISYAVGITLLIVSGFGIYNILNMMIYEKMDSIAILKATGFSGRDVKNIFMVIALSLGFFGGLLGLVFGFGLSNIISHIPFKTEALPNVKTYPILYKPITYIIAFVFAMLTTYFAGFFPARKASKVDPVTIIRGK